jgi:hypothetical protein
MSDDPILKRLQDMAGEHMSALVRQIYEAGWKAGENAAKQKVLNLFDAATAELTPRTRNNDSIAEMAKVSRPLRDAILMMNIGQDGVGPNEVFRFVNEQPGPKFDIWQVRAAIKTLEKRGDLTRVSRGKYRPAATIVEGPSAGGRSRSEPTPSDNGGKLFAPAANNLNGSVSSIALMSLEGAPQ